MKKRMITVVAMVVFSFTGIAIAESGMALTENLSMESVSYTEPLIIHPDSTVKKNEGMMTKKKGMEGEMGHKHNMQMMSHDSTRQATMMQMQAIMMKMKKMMKDSKMTNGKGMMDKHQKKKMFAMMEKMMPKDKAQRARMMQMNMMMMEMMKSCNMAKGKSMMSGQKADMKANMMQMMPKDSTQRAKMMQMMPKDSTQRANMMQMHGMMQKMMQQMAEKDKTKHKYN